MSIHETHEMHFNDSYGVCKKCWTCDCHGAIDLAESCPDEIVHPEMES